MIKKTRETFGSTFGVIAAAAGSAIGLGNIWKFPYITGEYGGAAFLVVYLIFIAAIGLPIMLAEFVVGRKGKRNAFGSFKRLVPNSWWRYIGYLGVASAFIILSYYGVVAGWALKYVVASATGILHNMSSGQILGYFREFTTSPFEPLIYQILFMFITGLVVIVGIKKGIEKYSKILMPLLLVIIIILDIRAVTLPGAGEGLKFLFYPDFSKLTSEGVLQALGHAFFSLSLGMGVLITYGSYVKRKNNLMKTASEVTIADTLIALLAGIAILPAVFAFGVEPGAGPGLVFATLPNVFQQMTGGMVFSVMFFVLLSIAALTSSISILEVAVAYFSEELKMKRKLATIMATILATLLGIICSLSFGILGDYKLFGKNFFDLLDFIAANVLMPLGGMFIALFVGWVFGKRRTKNELEYGGHINKLLLNGLIFLLRYVAPIAILIVFLNGIGFFEIVKNIWFKCNG